jgi:hypothetical protein
MAVVLIRLHNQGRLHSVVAQMMARLKRRAEGNNGAHRTTSVRDEEEKAGCQQIELTGGTHNRFQCDIVLLGSEQPLTPPIPRLRFDAVGSRRVLQALTGTADKPSARRVSQIVESLTNSLSDGRSPGDSPRNPSTLCVSVGTWRLRRGRIAGNCTGLHLGVSAIGLKPLTDRQGMSFSDDGDLFSNLAQHC